MTTQIEIIPPPNHTNEGANGFRKGRILTDILKAAAEEKLCFEDEDGNQAFMTKKEALAKMVWDAALTGKLTTIDMRETVIGTRDHLDLMKWIYVQVDGPAKPEVVSEDKRGEEDGESRVITESDRIARLTQILIGEAESGGIEGTGSNLSPTRRAILQLLAKTG